MADSANPADKSKKISGPDIVTLVNEVLAPTKEPVRSFSARGSDLPKTVLVAEDEILIRWAIAEYLRECGYRVIEVGSGDEAIDILRRTALTINVVFSDVQMPGSIDGFALAQWVRQERPAVKVVLTSGAAPVVDAAEALGNGTSLLPKPYSRSSLEQRIRSLLAE